MTESEIILLFNEAIKERAVFKKINVSVDVVYNWKSKKTIPSLGQMLEALYYLGLIKIENHEK